MAIVKAIKNPITTGEAVSKAITYITNPKKVSAVSFENCIGNTAELSKQFYVTRQAFNQNKNILAHHYVQSFSPEDNITPEQAHAIGQELVKKIAPGYQVVLGTHIDKGHIHNHFIINSCNIETGYKWHSNKSTLNNIRKESDILCKKHDLSVITEKGKYKGLDQTTYQLAKEGKSWKVNLVKDLDEAFSICKGKSDFINFLNKKDYSVKYSDVNITIHKNGEKKSICVDTLAKQFGMKYTKENIEKKLAISPSPVVRKEYVPKEKKSQKTFAGEWERLEAWTFSNKKNKMLRNTERLWRENQNHTSDIAGNISYKKLSEAQGENFQIKISADMISNLINKPIFYAVKKLADNTAIITVKEKDKTMLSKFIGISLADMEQQSEAMKNKAAYNKMKAEVLNGKLEYMMITPAQLSQLKSEYVSLAYFPKGDKVNIAFLPQTKENITKLLFPSEKEKNAEAAKQENNRIYSNLKASAAASGENLRYKIITREQLNHLKNTEIKFAVFPKDEKYNIAFLESDAERVQLAAEQQTEKEKKR